MAIRTHFDSRAGMEQVLAMGVEEGMRMVVAVAVTTARSDRRQCMTTATNLVTTKVAQSVSAPIVRRSGPAESAAGSWKPDHGR